MAGWGCEGLNARPGRRRSPPWVPAPAWVGRHPERHRAEASRTGSRSQTEVRCARASGSGPGRQEVTGEGHPSTALQLALGVTVTGQASAPPHALLYDGRLHPDFTATWGLSWTARHEAGGFGSDAEAGPPLLGLHLPHPALPEPGDGGDGPCSADFPPQGVFTAPGER